MIKPTVGRVVWFYGQENESEQEQPYAAIITHVVNDYRVNLTVFSAFGVSYGVSNVQLVQGDEPIEGTHCRWMPFQVGQAAKTEQLQAQVDAAAGKSTT